MRLVLSWFCWTINNTHKHSIPPSSSLHNLPSLSAPVATDKTSFMSKHRTCIMLMSSPVTNGETGPGERPHIPHPNPRVVARSDGDFEKLSVLYLYFYWTILKEPVHMFKTRQRFNKDVIKSEQIKRLCCPVVLLCMWMSQTQTTVNMSVTVIKWNHPYTCVAKAKSCQFNFLPWSVCQ